jgi:high affinity Mn2+ porin
MRIKWFFLFSLIFFVKITLAQQFSDSTHKNYYNFHFQATIVSQTYLPFSAPYSGQNSLKTGGDTENSLTATFFFGTRLWKNASLYINPEMSGGAGVSKATGLAGFTNGEIYRVGDPKPAVYFARFFFNQLIPLSSKFNYSEDGLNQLVERKPETYLDIRFGKFSIADYYDQNRFSHDPRASFLNWALMSNGAWDYPANTRGYTYAGMIEYVRPGWAARLSSSAVPTQANGEELEYRFNQAHSETLEGEHSYKIAHQEGTLRLLAFRTLAHMGNYALAIQSPDPDITLSRKYGRTKMGLGINLEQNINPDLGFMIRASFNDGKNETWAFTEIDQSISAALVQKGNLWNRPHDFAGLAMVINGISPDHRNYLAAGGYGFIIGDGQLNYGTEDILEAHYNFSVFKSLNISPDYQIVLNPGYNKDRKGPVNFFAIRAHIEL